MATYNDLIRKAQTIEREYRAVKEKGIKPFHIPAQGLGWDVAPSATDVSGLYTSDVQGFRMTAPDDTQDRKARPKISFWGNSIVFGGEVPDRDSWLWLLQEKLKGKATIYNGGVSGYGTDQGYLRFRQKLASFRPDIAFLAYSTSDLQRNINIERFFVNRSTNLIFLKPRFDLDGKGSFLLEPPFADYTQLSQVLKKRQTKAFLKRHDPFFPAPLRMRLHRYARLFGLGKGAPGFGNRGKEYAFAICRAVFSRFFALCEEKNIDGAAILLPVYTGKNVSGYDFDTVAKWLKQNGHACIDVRQAFEKKQDRDISRLFNPHNHYTRVCGEMVSGFVAEQISSMRWKQCNNFKH